MLFRPEGLIPSRRRAAELHEGVARRAALRRRRTQRRRRDGADWHDDDVLVAEDVRKEFGGLVAVNDVDFTVPRGKVISLIGPNGAGKTTFFNMLTGVYKPTAGRIMFLGEDVTGKPPHAITAARHRPHVPEHPPLPEHDRARERPRRHARAPERRTSSTRSCARRASSARRRRRASGRCELLQFVGPAAQGAGRRAKQPALRRPAPARGRARARDRAEAAAPRRADRRHEPAGVGRVHGVRRASCATSAS